MTVGESSVAVDGDDMSHIDHIASQEKITKKAVVHRAIVFYYQKWCEVL